MKKGELVLVVPVDYYGQLEKQPQKALRAIGQMFHPVNGEFLCSLTDEQIPKITIRHGPSGRHCYITIQHILELAANNMMRSDG